MSMQFMRRICPAVRVLAVMLLACTGPIAWARGDAAHAPTHRGSKRETRPAGEVSQPCQEVAPTVESAEGTVEWDPISCWDCETTDELLGSFLAGLIVTTPFCILFLRLRTRRGEAQGVRRILEL